MFKMLNRSAIVTLALLGTPALAALAAGAKAPDFKTPAVMAGKPFEFNLSQALKKWAGCALFLPRRLYQRLHA
jgi:thioredoxin-dependent peroxiredoxin